mmetsp:Transcript_67423/g.173609  ORF Transcript_67423/g.173609 Transcript_67423/m.173609 type:complete len:254 (-) Transcript_67423:681-1442(-)
MVSGRQVVHTSKARAWPDSACAHSTLRSAPSKVMSTTTISALVCTWTTRCLAIWNAAPTAWSRTCRVAVSSRPQARTTVSGPRTWSRTSSTGTTCSLEHMHSTMSCLSTTPASTTRTASIGRSPRTLLTRMLTTSATPSSLTTPAIAMACCRCWALPGRLPSSSRTSRSSVDQRRTTAPRSARASTVGAQGLVAPALSNIGWRTWTSPALWREESASSSAPRVPWTPGWCSRCSSPVRATTRCSAIDPWSART